MSFQKRPDTHTPMPSRMSLTGRRIAGELAPIDPTKALEAARNCPDAWYRVQALASVAEYANPPLDLSILEEAAREAQLCHDTYGEVAVMAWPIGVAYKRGRLVFAERELQKCLAKSSLVEPRASRAYALELIWRTCFAEEPRYAKPVWRKILEVCHPDHNWRAARLYLHIAQVEKHRLGSAVSVIRAMPVGKARKWLERRFGLSKKNHTTLPTRSEGIS